MGHKDYRRFIISRALLTFAIYAQSVIVALQVYNLTKSELALGLVGAAEFIPFLLAGFYGGYIADIIHRRKLIVLSTAMYTVCSMLLLLSSVFFQSLPGMTGLYFIYVIIFLTGIARAFFAPAQGAYIAQILPREELVYAATVGSVAFNISSILGSAAGGILYAVIHEEGTYSLVVIFGIMSLLGFIRLPMKPLPESKQNENIFVKLAEGLRFVFKTEILIAALALDMFAVLFGGAVAMLPVFADKVLHVGPSGYGLLKASSSAGAILVALFLAVKPPQTKTGIKLLIAVAGFGLCMIVFALSRNFWLSMFVLFLSGVFDGISVVIRGTIVPLFAPDHMRGRVESVNKIFIGSSNELGEFESGLAAKWMGLIPSVIFGGCMTLFIVAIAAFKSPKLRALEFKDYSE